MPTESLLPKDDPCVIAFDQWKKSAEGQNTLRWAVEPEHAEGSIWAAFVAGRNSANATAANDSPPTDAGEQVKKALDEAIREAISDAQIAAHDLAGASARRSADESRAEAYRMADSVIATIERLERERDSLRTKLEAAEKVIEKTASFIASEYAADNDMGVLIPDAEPRRIHEMLCDFLDRGKSKS